MRLEAQSNRLDFYMINTSEVTQEEVVLQLGIVAGVTTLEESESELFKIGDRVELKIGAKSSRKYAIIQEVVVDKKVKWKALLRIYDRKFT